MRLVDFTTVELQRVARAVLRCYVEVQTGVAPAAALARFFAPAAAAGLAAGGWRLAAGGTTGGMARHADFGPVMCCGWARTVPTRLRL